MQPTFIAAIQAMIGVAILLRGTLRGAFAFMLFCGLFAGSAALVLPALGGSSIPPLQLALVFVILTLVLAPHRYLWALPEALRANLWLVAFVGYGIASAIIAPRLFAGSIAVAPLKPTDSPDPFDTVLLGPNSQNLTSAFYLFGTLAVAVAAYLVARTCRGGVASLISAAIAIGWCHVLLGIAVMAAHGTVLDGLFNLLRNGNYAQLDQAYQGFVRIRGLFPESSAYADFGFAFMVLNAELWYRSIRPTSTGSVAFALAVVLAFSTSSTAYVSLLAYALFFVIRAFFLPRLAPASRLRQFAGAVMVIAMTAALLMLVVPALPQQFFDMVHGMTVAKSDSFSGRQRLFWAEQGWDAFIGSHGVGIGAGSFRSSSLLTAILGSMGVIGVVTFGAYLVSVFQPLRQSTYGRTTLLDQTIGGAFAVAAVLSLVPSAVSSSKPDPGTNFAFMAGASLAMRPRQRRRKAEPDAAAEACLPAVAAEYVPPIAAAVAR